MRNTVTQPVAKDALRSEGGDLNERWGGGGGEGQVTAEHLYIQLKPGQRVTKTTEEVIDWSCKRGLWTWDFLREKLLPKDLKKRLFQGDYSNSSDKWAAVCRMNCSESPEIGKSMICTFLPPIELFLTGHKSPYMHVICKLIVYITFQDSWLAKHHMFQGLDFLSCATDEGNTKFYSYAIGKHIEKW